MPYLSDEELDRLIADTESAGMLTAPSFLKKEVFHEIQRRKNISQMNAVRLKTWQIVTVVAASILFMTVMPLEQQASVRDASGIPGNIRQESVLLNQTTTVKDHAWGEKAQQDRIGTWMYEKKHQVGTAVRMAADQLLPTAFSSRGDAVFQRSHGSSNEFLQD